MPTPAEGAQVAKFLHQKGNSRDQVRHQLQRNGHPVGEASQLARDEFEPPAPTTPPPAPAAKPAPAPGGFGVGLKDGARQGKKMRPRGASKSGKPLLGLPGGPSTPAGFLLAVVTYPLFLAWVRGGTPAVHAWFNAKFFNKTGPSSTTTPPVVGTPGTPGFNPNPKAFPKPGQPFYAPPGPDGKPYGTGTGA